MPTQPLPRAQRWRKRLISTEPATGAEIWSGEIGDAAAEVAAARAAWPEWAAHSIAYRIETLRRFANVVRSRESEFADLIARETGKPLWEAHTEVGAVINKVEISATAYVERTPMRGWRRARQQGRGAPQAAWRAGGARALQFPRAFAQRPYRPGADRRQRRGLQAVGEDPGDAAPCWSTASTPPAFPKGVLRLLVGGPDQGKALAAEPGIDGLLFTGSVRAGMALHKQFADMPNKILALELGGNNPLVVWDAKDIEAAAVIVVQSAYLSAGQRCTAARRLIVEDGQEEQAGRCDLQADRPADRRRAASPSRSRSWAR